MSARTRTWAVALGALCLLAGALAAVALAAPARRACRPVRGCQRNECLPVRSISDRSGRAPHCSTRACPSTHAHRCPRSRGARQPHRHKHVRRTPAQPAGSAGPAPSNPSTPSGSSPPPAPAASSAGSPPAAGEPATEAPTSPVGAPAPARVQVIAREYSFTLSRSEVPAGEVIVELVNRGEDPHNLHVLEPTEGAEAGAFPNTTPGTVHDLKLKLHAGSYTLFCSLPGHEAKGMHATLLVH